MVILPDLRWPLALRRWREAEGAGFATAWTYDHLSWRTLREGPWLTAVPLLAAVAASTERLRLGTLVATPNFRHPVLLAKDAVALDEVSGGRLELGLGAGGAGPDATVLGWPGLDAPGRAARFSDFVDTLDTVLTHPGGASVTTVSYTAVDARSLPGCTQQPRVPFTVAASGPRGMRVAVRHARTWATFGPLRGADGPAAWRSAVAAQVDVLDAACHELGRDPASLRRLALVGLDLAWAQDSVTGWDELCGWLAEHAFTDVVLHWPRPADPGLPGPSPAVFAAVCERLAGGPRPR